MRFTTSQTDVYADHLDWHYRQNRTEKDVSRKAQFISGTIAPFINLIDNFGYILIAIIGGYLIVNDGVFAVNGTVLYDM